MKFCVSQKGSDDEEEIVIAAADFAFHIVVNIVRYHTNEKQRCVEQKVVVILGLSVFKQQHTQELNQWHKH